MGKAKRNRRRAKHKDRERQRLRRDHRADRGNASTQSAGGAGGGADGQHADENGRRPLVAEAVLLLVTAAISAQFEGNRDALAWCAAQLASEAGAYAPGNSGITDGPNAAAVPGWQRVVNQKLWELLWRAVTISWHQGWQPAELVRQVERQFSARHARLATDAVASEMRGYADATVDDRWAAQLAALGAKPWWDRDDDYLTNWGVRERIDRTAVVTCLLETLFALADLPDLAHLCPLPGSARSGTLADDHAPSPPVDQRMLDRVRALLAKAESTEFPEEAEALTSRAQELMVKHSIDDAVLAAATERSGRPGPGEAEVSRVFVDSPYEAPKALLLDAIAKANRCRSILHKNLGLCTVVGFPADLNGVQLLFTSLLVQATTAMVAAGSRQDAWGRSRTRSFRQSFLAAYAQRIRERLSEATGAAERQVAAETPGVDLLPVLAARHRIVDEAFEAMFPDHLKFSAGSVNDREGWITGRAAADFAVLHGRRAVTGDAA